MWDSNCFITLTYEDSKLPYQGSLVYKDFQRFMKRLRKRVGPVRFYMCGEYGDQFWRPHFHACLFGYDFPDRKHFKKMPSGFKISTSEILSSIWTDGFASVGELSFESAAYVARYVMKKITGPQAAAHYERLDLSSGEIFSLVPEFTQMSLKPGIGAEWFKKFRSDVYPHDEVVLRGMKMKPPKYYDRLLLEAEDFMSDEIEYSRYLKSKAVANDCTPDRLMTRELVTRSRLALKRRSLE